MLVDQPDGKSLPGHLRRLRLRARRLRSEVRHRRLDDHQRPGQLRHHQERARRQHRPHRHRAYHGRTPPLRRGHSGTERLGHLPGQHHGQQRQRPGRPQPKGQFRSAAETSQPRLPWRPRGHARRRPPARTTSTSCSRTRLAPRWASTRCAGTDRGAGLETAVVVAHDPPPGLVASLALAVYAAITLALFKSSL